MSKAKVPDIHDLVADVDLLSVSVLDLAATRNDLNIGTDELNEKYGDGYTASPSFRLLLDKDDESRHLFRVRLIVEVDSEPGTIKVHLAAEYELKQLDTEQIPEALILEFVNKVALMAMLPFVRQYIADMSQRVFIQPLTMPVYRAGDLSFGTFSDVA